MNSPTELRRSAVTADRIVALASRGEPASVEIGLNAAIVAVADNEPVALIIRGEADVAGATDGLPFGPFSPLEHRTFEIGLRDWVRAQTGVELGYAEQLYTFGDRGRSEKTGDVGPHVVSIGYLALTEAKSSLKLARGSWHSWYHYFPWEDWRKGRPAILDHTIEPRLRDWASRPITHTASMRPISRQERVRICFGFDGASWDEEKVLERFELLYDAGLVDEAARDGRDTAKTWQERPRLGTPMRFDHRRILATAIGRVRAKIKYRPVSFELMPGEFTLYELQRTGEASLGPHLHKQNFRRLVEGAVLVELLERPAPGVRVKPGKN
jgi:hypothetical protein